MANVGTRTINIPVAELVSGMSQLYRERMFGTDDEIDLLAREILYTRECFYWLTNDFVATEVTFAVANYDLTGERLSSLIYELNLEQPTCNEASLAKSMEMGQGMATRADWFSQVSI